MNPDFDDNAFAQGWEGRRLGDFVLRELLGAGGMGAVFLAEQPMLERQAVVKIARGAALASDAQPATAPRNVTLATAATPAPSAPLEAFLREARLASRLDHPYAAHVYAFGAEPDGTRWIAMELVRGSDLATMLRAGPLPVARAIQLLVRLCEVVEAAHEKGILHRDIKPANVMVIARAGAVFPKLLDLGIAGEFGAASTPNQGDKRLAGTPAYMAPEQWVRGAPQDARTDVYALGALAYEMIVGAPPFRGANARELAVAHARQAVPALPAELAALHPIIARAMAKRPAERYTSALAFAHALRDAAGVSLEASDLPQLDALTRDEIMLSAPQAIAQAVAQLDAAQTVPQLRRAMDEVVLAIAQTCGLWALAIRRKVGSRRADSLALQSLLHTVTAEMPSASQWWQLTREVMRLYAEVPALCPVAELVEYCFASGTEIHTAFDTLLGSTAPHENERPSPLQAPPRDAPLAVAAVAPIERERQRLVAEVTLLSQVLRAMRFLTSYKVVEVHPAPDTTMTLWVGLRRHPAPTCRAPDGVPPGLALVATDHSYTCTLGGCYEVAAPSPGAPLELFALRGANPQGEARFGVAGTAWQRHHRDHWPTLGLQHTTSPAELATLASDGQAPYLGLATFAPNDSARFFGREQETEAFVNRLVDHAFIAVVGPSGAGKSSFVQAGIVPQLRTAHHVVIMRPGTTPFAALQHAAAKAAQASSATTTDLAFVIAPGAAAQNAARVRAHVSPTTPLLLVVDQFEELVTQCHDAEARHAFAELLLALGQIGQCTVIVTLRDDFLLRVAQLAPLREVLATRLHLVTTPTRSDLQRILTEPARRVGYAFEDDALVEEIVDQVQQQSAALALLSFTAAQIWQFRDRQFRRLTRAAYRQLGGIGGAMSYHAEAVLAELPPRAHAIVREVFRHLVTADGTRAAMSKAELLEVTGDDTAREVLEHLISARLLIAQEGDGGAERVEVIHEALISAWPRLVNWRNDDAALARLRDQLRAAAKQWHDRGRPRGLLWRDDALAEYQLWRAKYPGRVTAQEHEFGTASLAYARRTKRIRQSLLGVAMTTLLIGVVILARANRRVEAARASTQNLLEASLYEQGRAAFVSGDLAAAAHAWQQFTQTRAADLGLRHMLARADANVRAITWHRQLSQQPIVGLVMHETRLLALGDDGTLHTLDIATGTVQSSINVDREGDALLAAPDGRGGVLSVGPSGGRWQPQAAGPVHTLPHADDWLMAAWCDNTAVTLGYGKNELQVWQAHGARAYGHALPDYPFAVTCWRGAPLIATASALWQADASGLHVVFGAPPQATDGTAVEGAASATAANAAPVTTDAATTVSTTALDRTNRPTGGNTLAVHAASQTLAVALGAPATIHIIDRSGAVRAVLTGHAATVTHASFSADGTSLLTGDQAGEVRWWHLAAGTFTQLSGHLGSIAAIAFADEQAVTTDAAGTTRLWTAEGLAVAAWSGPATARALQVTPSHVIVGYDNGEVRALARAATDLAAAHPIALQASCLGYNRHGAHVRCEALARIDVYDAQQRRTRQLDAGFAEGDFSCVALGDTGAVTTFAAGATAGRYFAPAGTSYVPLVAPAPIRTVATSHTADQAFATSTDGHVFAWDGSGRLMWQQRFADEQLSALAPHPTLPMLAVPMRGYEIGIIDAATGQLRLTLRGHTGELTHLRFTEDGARLLSASSDGTARVWDIGSAARVNASQAAAAPNPSLAATRILRGHRGRVNAVAEAAGGLVATIGEDRELRIWHEHQDVAVRTLRVSHSEPWQLYRAADGEQLAILDEFGIRWWHAGLFPAASTALHAALACVRTPQQCAAPQAK